MTSEQYKEGIRQMMLSAHEVDDIDSSMKGWIIRHLKQLSDALKGESDDS